MNAIILSGPPRDNRHRPMLCQFKVEGERLFLTTIHRPFSGNSEENQYDFPIEAVALGGMLLLAQSNCMEAVSLEFLDEDNTSIRFKANEIRQFQLEKAEKKFRRILGETTGKELSDSTVNQIRSIVEKQKQILTHSNKIEVTITEKENQDKLHLDAIAAGKLYHLIHRYSAVTPQVFIGGLQTQRHDYGIAFRTGTSPLELIKTKDIIYVLQTLHRFISAGGRFITRFQTGDRRIQIYGQSQKEPNLIWFNIRDRIATLTRYQAAMLFCFIEMCLANNP